MRIIITIALMLSAQLCMGSSYKAEWIYQESLTLYNKGKYEEALVGFMDALDEEPSHEKALVFMKKAGQILADRERASESRKREDILKDADIIREYLPQMRRQMQDRLSAWQRRASDLAVTASGGAEPGLFWKAYEALVASAPISSDSASVFDSQTAILRAGLAKATVKTYPALAVVFDGMRKKPLSYKIPDGAEFPEPARAALSAMRQALEKEAVAHTAMLSARDAMALYRAATYAESASSWDEVLVFDPKNPQALFYGPRAKSRIKTIGGAPMVVARVEPAAASEQGSMPHYADNETAETKGAVAAKTGSDPSAQAEEQKKQPAGQKPVAVAEQPRAAISLAKPVLDMSIQSGADDKTKIKAHADALYTKGLRFYAQGDSREAAALWRKCLEIDPTHPRALRALERVKREIGE